MLRNTFIQLKQPDRNRQTFIVRVKQRHATQPERGGKQTYPS